MITLVESIIGIGQVGLLLDIVGFVVIFIFGGFQVGISTYMSDEYSWYALPARILGLLMIVVGFTFQFIGSGRDANTKY